ncbi:MAG TPA: glucose-6-phosphate dehydrogenase assembly protein OpcA [Candidatus Limnocylindrales bacterium]
MLALWDTSGSEVVKKLAAERRSAGGVASGLALTFVVIVDEGRVRQVEDAATIAASAHPCRLLVVTRGPVPGPDVATAQAKDRLDAEIIVGGRLGPTEAVIMRMHGRLALHSESVIMPLLAPDVPVVIWWHGPPPDRIATDPLGVVAERRITDVAQCEDPAKALLQRAEDYAPGDTDLAWTRLTGWRSLIAGAFDTLDGEVSAATVSGRLADPAAALLRGWLAARLGIPVGLHAAKELSAVDFHLADGSVMALRNNGNGTATLVRTGVSDRVLPLVRRRLGEELAEELRRLDPDQPYGLALQAATGLNGLNERSATRTHVWRDPALT